MSAAGLRVERTGCEGGLVYVQGPGPEDLPVVAVDGDVCLHSQEQQSKGEHTKIIRYYEVTLRMENL